MIHAFLAPSSASVWGVCAAAPHVAVMFPEDEDSEKSRLGTAVHWAGEQGITGNVIAEGTAAPNGVIIDAESVECASWYVWHVLSVLKSCNMTLESPNCGLEERIPIPFIHKECFGTPDFWAYSLNTNTLHVIDYKNGHLNVDAFENGQLIAYACGLIEKLQFVSKFASLLPFTVKLTVIQPRSYRGGGPIDTWTTTSTELIGYFEKLQKAALAVYATPDLATSGPHCHHCTGRHACQAAQDAAMASIDRSRQVTPVELDGHALGYEMRETDRAIQSLQYRQTAYEEQAKGMLKRGELVAGYAMQSKQGNLKWLMPSEMIYMVGDSQNVETRNIKPITPLQAEKAGLNIDGMAARPTTLTLTKKNQRAALLVFQQRTGE